MSDSNDMIWRRGDALAKLALAAGMPDGELDRRVPGRAWTRYLVAALRALPGLPPGSLGAITACEDRNLRALSQSGRAAPILDALAAYREAVGLPPFDAFQTNAIVTGGHQPHRYLPTSQSPAEWHPTAVVADVIGQMARPAAWGHHTHLRVAMTATRLLLAHHVGMDTLTALLGCVAGDPYAPARRLRRGWIDESAVEAVDAVVALESYLLRDGHADQVAYSALADALDDAGCTEARLLSHLRGPGPHARGCWVVRAIAGFDGRIR